MRKIIVQNMVSLDGFIAGPNGEFDWPLADQEFEQYALERLNTYDTFLLGRVTYQMFASYWPTAITNTSGTLSKEGVKFTVPKEVSDIHTEVANKMNSLQKIVFSKTLKNADWNNSKLFVQVVPEEIMKLKQQNGKDMVMLGSADLISTFTKLDLIDEYHLFVNPVVLGDGKPMFKDLNERLKLKLTKTKTFKSGLVGLYYQPVK